ncbi:HCO3- transporter family domain-containing protein [Ditylenchus destructor]|uniref:Anion exchange protein n=1 Tax=Ditylenchus destructor TaxID=166010 RepID=A0AAD4N3G3_9BILA|nr:HCO3- transporter family domain-containing protein [Ditylenchus destructor]
MSGETGEGDAGDADGTSGSAQKPPESGPVTNPESQSTAVGSPTNASNPQHQNTITSTTSGGSAGRAGGGISFDLHTPPAQQDASAQERRESLWVSMGVHRSNDGGGSTIRKRRMSKQRESLELPTAEQMQNLEDMAPGTRVMFLLKEKDEVPALFTEMGELTRSGNMEEWKETARWVKFEEDVEEGGNRWSKPHVATLSLHALFQLRSCLLNGVLLIDLEVESLPQLIECILDELIRTSCLQESDRDNVRHVLSRRHTHQYEQARNGGSNNGAGQGGFLNAVRSISDIGKSFSHGKNLHKTGAAGTDTDSDGSPKKAGAQLELPKVGSLPKDIHSKDSSTSDFGRNAHFMKKLPAGVEASNVLVGEVDFLSHHITAFVRLKNAQLLGDLTEVPVPTRFLFFLLGPSGHAAQFKEIGRAIATLMSDEIFHDVAYKARDRTDLLDGVDEFLDSVTVLPPGEWDPNIRIEPPTVIPSQQKRVQASKDILNNMEMYSGGPIKGVLKGSGGAKKTSLEEEDVHGNDPALQRTGKLFGGLIADIKRKLPWYKSDYTDAFNMQCVATFCFMYFALLAPIVTFGGLLEEATHQRMAAMENLASGAICGVIYHIFSGQPLTVIGSTGPVLVFETIVYDMCETLGLQYLSFRLWVYIWTAIILFGMVITDASSLVSYITRFTEESFATLIAVIFIYEAIMKLYNIGNMLDVIDRPPLPGSSPTCHCIGTGASVDKVRALAHKFHWDDAVPHNSTFVDYSNMDLSQCKRLLGRLEGPGCFVLYDKFLMSLVLMVGTFFLAITLKKMRNSCYFPSKVRQICSDFAVMIAIMAMTVVDLLVGINTPKLNVPSTFRPTWSGRGWVVSPFDNQLWTIPVAIIPALLACILIFMDQQITAVIVNRKENKLKKGCGYHLDLFILSILIVVVGFLGLPVYVAATVLSINHVNSLKLESESRAPGEVAHFVGVREQRVTGIVTFVLIGLSVTMTNILGHIPMPVLYGVFLYMGIAALGGIQLFDRILLLLMPMKYQPDTIYIRHVPINSIHRFTMCQVACLAVLWIVKSIKKTSIAFPIMLVVMVAVRKLMEKIFTEKELKYLDDAMPDFHLRKKEDMRRSSKNENVEIDLDENQGTIHAVKTEAHLHIPMTSGNVIKIPLAAIQEPSHNINISKEVNSSGMWRHITSESKTSLQKMAGSTGQSEHGTNSPRLATPEEDDEAITINIVKPSPSDSMQECQPLLKKNNENESPV